MSQVLIHQYLAELDRLKRVSGTHREAARVKVVVASFMQPAAAYRLLSSALRRLSRVRD